MHLSTQFLRPFEMPLSNDSVSAIFTKRMDDHVCVNNDIYSSDYYRMLSELTIAKDKDPIPSFLVL